MTRRRRDEGSALSLDSFLDIVTNVVGALILIAVVTVLSAGDISVSSGASALTKPNPTARRIVLECAKGQLFFVDETTNARRVRLAIETELREARDVDRVVEYLANTDVGDDTYRVRAESIDATLAWTYELRDDATGDTEADLEAGNSALERALDQLEAGGFAYFVVHDDSFDVFRRARDITTARGIATGWHPVLGTTPIRISVAGDLGKHVQ